MDHSFFRVTISAAVAAAASACGGGSDPTVEVRTITPALEVVADGMKMPPMAPMAETVTAPSVAATIAAVGTSLVMGTDKGVLRRDQGVTISLEVWGDEPNRPEDTGAVRALARREGDVLVAADRGLFVAGAARLSWSQASPALGATLDVDVKGSGKSETIWLASASGLYRIASDKLERWILPGEAGAPTAVGQASDRVLAAFGARLYEIDTASRMAFAVTHDFGAIRAITLGPGGAAYLASERALVVREAGGNYLHHEIAGVSDVSADPRAGVYFTCQRGIGVARAPRQIEGLAPLPAPAGARLIASDDAGKVWVGEGAKLSGFALGKPISFAKDVKPIFEQRCATCHAAPAKNNATPVDFLDYAVAVAKRDQVIARISAGQMPPASAEPLSTEQSQLILRWYASGAKP